MKKITLLTFILLLGVPGLLWSQQTRSIVTDPQTQERERFDLQDFYANSHLLVIGINDYSHGNFTDLENAVNDARAVKQVLQEQYGFAEENTVALYDEEATRRRILDEMHRIASEAGEDDRILIYFAGHGQDSDLPTGGSEGFIIPYDGEYDAMPATAIDTRELERVGHRTEARHMLYILDACYGGLLTTARSLDRLPDISDRDMEFIRNRNQRQTRRAITAGDDDEAVSDAGREGHSYFTYYLLDGLRELEADVQGRGFFTARDLHEHVEINVLRDTQDHQFPQDPQFAQLSRDDDGAFLFIPVEREQDQLAIVEITSTPENAEVYLDGDLAGITPFQFETSYGSHQIEIQREGYDDFSQTIDVERGTLNSFEFDLDAETVPLTVVTNVEEPQVLIDGNPVERIEGNVAEEGLRPGQYMLQVAAEGYHTEFERIEIEPGDEHRETINLESIYSELSVITGHDEAEIYIDGEQAGTGEAQEELEEGGNYLVEVQMDGYEPFEEEIQLFEDREIRPDLESAFVELDLEVAQDDATIYLDDEEIGTGSIQTEVERGIYTLIVEKEDHHPERRELDLFEDQQLDIELESMIKQLQVNVKPDDARIYVDGEELGRGPQLETELREGDYTLRAEREGYEPEERELRLGTDRQIDVELEQILLPVQIAADEEDAQVYIDGEPMGLAPYSTELPYGTYEVTVEKENHEPYTEELTVPEDQSVTARMMMTVEYEAQQIYDSRRSSNNFWTGTHLVLTAVSSAYAVVSHVNADEAYDRYQQTTGVTGSELEERWDMYERYVMHRNVSLGAAGGFALFSMIAIIRGPDKDDILEEVRQERREEGVTMRMDYGRSYAGVRLTINF